MHALERVRAWTEEVLPATTPRGAVDGSADPGLGSPNPRSQSPELTRDGGMRALASVCATEVETADPGPGVPDPPHRPPQDANDDGKEGGGRDVAESGRSEPRKG
jgi:hypothetical protein